MRNNIGRENDNVFVKIILSSYRIMCGLFIIQSKSKYIDQYMILIAAVRVYRGFSPSKPVKLKCFNSFGICYIFLTIFFKLFFYKTIVISNILN